MAQLRQDYSKFKENNTEILVVGPEGTAEFQIFWKEQKIPFIGIPDPDHKVLNQYGQRVNYFKLGRMPAQFLIDKNQKIRFINYGDSMMDIAENKEILSLIEEINQEYEGLTV